MTQTPAGWHATPEKPEQLRYWDGSAWTEHFAPATEPVAGRTVQPDQPDKPQDYKSLQQYLTELSAFFTVIGLLFYAVLRTAYSNFYNEAGIEPEDVGLGKTELLAQAVTGPVVIVLVYSMVYIPLMRWSTKSKKGKATGASAPRYIVRAVGLAVLAVVVLMFLASHKLTSEMKDGNAARTGHLNLYFFQLPLLQIWALPVDLAPGDDKPLPPELTDTSCMFYLGESEGTGVLYDVKNERAVRFKTDSVIITTSREPELLDRECLPD